MENTKEFDAAAGIAGRRRWSCTWSSGVEAERRALERELHDEVSGMLAAARMDVSFLKTRADQAPTLRSTSSASTARWTVRSARRARSCSPCGRRCSITSGCRSRSSIMSRKPAAPRAPQSSRADAGRVRGRRSATADRDVSRRAGIAGHRCGPRGFAVEMFEFPEARIGWKSGCHMARCRAAAQSGDGKSRPGRPAHLDCFHWTASGMVQRIGRGRDSHV